MTNSKSLQQLRNDIYTHIIKLEYVLINLKCIFRIDLDGAAMNTLWPPPSFHQQHM